jgi:hypothetical protein
MMANEFEMSMIGELSYVNDGPDGVSAIVPEYMNAP